MTMLHEWWTAWESPRQPDEVLEEREEVRLFWDILFSLRQRYRLALILRYGLDGGPLRSLEEVAQGVGVGTTNTASDLVLRAYLAIKCILKNRRTRAEVEMEAKEDQ